ncbi:hypothetical protein N9E66_01820 [Gammaproteobacteria bacterium]|nr:hypothetical protein [Gammaproteobacteria bacterium]
MKLLYLTLMVSISFQLVASSSEQIDCTSEVDTSFFNSTYYKNREVSFLDTEADLELKNLIKNKHNIKGVPTLKDLDGLFEWDRINNMEYIYKILDLMDRSYVVNNKNIDDFKKYKLKFNNYCEDTNDNV